jgi:hypothetical protein
LQPWYGISHAAIELMVLVVRLCPNWLFFQLCFMVTTTLAEETVVAQTILDECFARLLPLRIRLRIGDSHEPFRQLSGIL